MPGFPFGSGFSTLVWLIAIVIVSVVVWRGRSGFVSGTPIVLSKFLVNEDLTARTSVEIVGRASGPVSWILTALRLEPEFRLVVTNSEVSIRRGSLSGLSHIYVPLGKISAVVCGYQRSVLALGFATLFAVGFLLNLLSGFFENSSQVGSDMGLAFGFLILAGIAGLVYFLSKRIGIVVETMHPHGLAFKRSVIENVSVDLPEALRAISIINARILAAQTIQTVADRSDTQALPLAAASKPPDASAPGGCPQCSTANPIGTRFCENCGSPLPA